MANIIAAKDLRAGHTIHFKNDIYLVLDNSFNKTAMLDMRMSQSGESAKDIVNTYDEQELADLIYQYGEEKNMEMFKSSLPDTNNMV